MHLSGDEKPPEFCFLFPGGRWLFLAQHSHPISAPRTLLHSARRIRQRRQHLDSLLFAREEAFFQEAACSPPQATRREGRMSNCSKCSIDSSSLNEELQRPLTMTIYNRVQCSTIPRIKNMAAGAWSTDTEPSTALNREGRTVEGVSGMFARGAAKLPERETSRRPAATEYQSMHRRGHQ
jgi:hypothetical protein